MAEPKEGIEPATRMSSEASLINRLIGISEIAIASIGSVYVVGFVVLTGYLASKNIFVASISSQQYLRAGLSFCFFAAPLIALAMVSEGYRFATRRDFETKTALWLYLYLVIFMASPDLGRAARAILAFTVLVIGIQVAGAVIPRLFSETSTKKRIIEKFRLPIYLIFYLAAPVGLVLLLLPKSAQNVFFGLCVCYFVFYLLLAPAAPGPGWIPLSRISVHRSVSILFAVGLGALSLVLVLSSFGSLVLPNIRAEFGGMTPQSVSLTIAEGHVAPEIQQLLTSDNVQLVLRTSSTVFIEYQDSTAKRYIEIPTSAVTSIEFLKPKTSAELAAEKTTTQADSLSD